MDLFNRTKDKEEEFVSVWDFQTHTTHRIPARELAPGMVQVQIEGIEGTFWADVSQLELRQSGMKHPPFDENVRLFIREIQQAMAEFYPLSLEEWEDGFRRDTNYEREIAIWLHMARTFQAVLRSHEWGDAERKDIFRVLLACLNVPREHVLKTCSLDALSIEDAQRITALYFKSD